MTRPIPPIALALLLLAAPALLAAAWLQDSARESAQEPGQEEQRFTPLVRGTDPEQFRLVEIDEETITISGEGEVALSGTPNGYFATRDSYEDYILRFDWKYDRPEDLEDDEAFDGNSGLLLHIEEPHKVWPRCVEVQLMNRDAGDLLALDGAKIEDRRSPEQRQSAREEAIKPVGEWNRTEVRVRNGTVRCTINDVLISEGTGAEPSSGPIGWQSEGRPIRFRNLKIQGLH